MKNKWKTGFLLLVGVNLFFTLVVILMLMSPFAETKNSDELGLVGEHVAFQVKSNKLDLNKLINNYLKVEAADSPIGYRIILGEEVELYGTLPLFSQEINMKLTFEPEALPNGDLVLKQKSMSVGSLDLPISYVLKFISENYKLPNGVDIRPKDKLIYVNMQQLKLKSDMKIKANKFDLKNDDIAFTILVPIK
ncbi:MAG: YpmS family protein [Bacillus sp. (in: Bacteria)]|nr:YpmS family protein [Bacillus sp. (in: firmicutes)]